MTEVSIIQGDVRDVLPTFPEYHFDACLCDPPYEISFMGRKWDGTGVSFTPDTWAAVLRCLKPGASLMAFGAPRNVHRLTCAIEDAGLEVKDLMLYMFGSGFPKSHNISKSLDKAKRTDRQPSDAAHAFDGYGTALKPSYEPIVWAMAPLDGTYAQNALAHGVAGLNIDAGRVGTDAPRPWREKDGDTSGNDQAVFGTLHKTGTRAVEDTVSGRWPANVLHDGSPEVLEAFAAFGEKTSGVKVGGQYSRQGGVHGGGQRVDGTACYGDTGTAARFFYTAKAGSRERYFYCDICGDAYPHADRDQHAHARNSTDHLISHPTVKPLSLVTYLASMLLPPPRSDGQPRRILIPFSGSGSEAVGAIQGGWEEVVCIEQDARYVQISRRRVEVPCAVLL